MTDMRPSPDSSPGPPGGRSGVAWRPISGWLLGEVGGIGVLLGGFILVASEDQYVGIGGDLSWRVGDIDPIVAVGLVLGGFALALAGLRLVIVGSRAPRPAVQDTGLRDLALHAVAFTIVNAFLWIQDIAIGGGLEYAYWVTIPWGIGLAIHALVYFVNPHGQRPGAAQLR
jgi:hypothetical protein